MVKFQLLCSSLSPILGSDLLRGGGGEALGTGEEGSVQVERGPWAHAVGGGQAESEGRFRRRACVPACSGALARCILSRLCIRIITVVYGFYEVK